MMEERNESLKAPDKVRLGNGLRAGELVAVGPRSFMARADSLTFQRPLVTLQTNCTWSQQESLTFRT